MLEEAEFKIIYIFPERKAKDLSRNIVKLKKYSSMVVVARK